MWGFGEVVLIGGAPEPAHGVGEDGGAVFAVVGAFASDELVIPVGEFEGCGHVLVGDPPTAELVIDIVFAVLEEDADGAAELEELFFLWGVVGFVGVFEAGLADGRRVDVAAADVGEAADVGDDFLELVGAVPGGGEGADAAAAVAADGA